MRLKRRKGAAVKLTDEERVKLAHARRARDEAHVELAATRGRTREVEDLASWLRRARAKNNFSERISLMLQNPREDPPWPS